MSKAISLAEIKAFCKEREIKLTPLRQDVLTLVCRSTQPLGAYEILRQLRKHRPNAEPPTVYRVLEFLQSESLIHRIDSSNAYIACIHPHKSHGSQLLLCKTCGDATEIDDKKITKTLQNFAEFYGFTLTTDLTELRGVCKECR